MADRLTTLALEPMRLGRLREAAARTVVGLVTGLLGLLLGVLSVGEAPLPAALALLLLEGLRIFLSRLDPWAAVTVSAALLLYLFGPGPFRLSFRFPARPTSNQAGS